MKISELLNIIEQIAPADTVWDKDNIGLLVGHHDRQVTSALAALDVSLDVINEANERGAQVILAHHPLIFGGVGTVTDETATGRRVMALLRYDIAAICLHTNYDGAEGGLNDELARLIGLRDVRVLVNQNGEYGRCGELAESMTASGYARFVKETLNVSALRYHDAGRPVNKVSVGSGGSGKLFERAVAAGCDTFVTGDVGHNIFCDARDVGINVIDATHFATEDIMCDLLIRQLASRAPELTVTKARASRAPYEVL